MTGRVIRAAFVWLNVCRSAGRTGWLGDDYTETPQHTEIIHDAAAQADVHSELEQPAVLPTKGLLSLCFFSFCCLTQCYYYIVLLGSTVLWTLIFSTFCELKMVEIAM